MWNWRYTRYFDGSQELYDLKNDPQEWTNLIDDSAHAKTVKRLAKAIPDDPNYKHFVRYGDFKAVVPSDGSPLMLYGPKVEMFAEAKDVAQQYPVITAKIEAFLKDHNGPEKHLNMDVL